MNTDKKLQDFKKEIEKLREIDGAEEYAKQLARLFLGNGLSLQTILLMAIDFGQQHPQWIPVEDELPKENTVVLIFIDLTEHFQEETYLYKVCLFDGKRFDADIVTLGNVTHWMEIVPPRKEARYD